MVATLTHTICAHSSDVNGVAFTANYLATCSGDKTVRMWMLDDYSEHATSPLCGHTYSVNCCIFSPNGSMLASCSTDGKLILWDSKSGDKLAVLQHKSKGSIRVCRFSSDSTLMATGSDDELMCLWNLSTRKIIRSVYFQLLF